MKRGTKEVKDVAVVLHSVRLEALQEMKGWRKVCQHAERILERCADNGLLCIDCLLPLEANGDCLHCLGASGTDEPC